MLVHGLLDQGDQGHDAPLSAVVGAHDEHHVLERHHQNQGPEHQGQHAHDVGFIGADLVAEVKDFLDRI